MTTKTATKKQTSPKTGQGIEPIVISNVGPIVGDFVVPLDSGPGLFVMFGGKGCGKTHVLDCINSLIRGSVGNETVHDGELAGGIKGLGRELPVGSKRRARGDFEGSSLDFTRYSIEDVIDPPQRTPGPADAHRIKALASLCGVECEPEDYHELAGGRATFEMLLGPEKLKTDDPVVLAGRVKDAFDAQARRLEDLAKHEEGHAAGCQAAFIDPFSVDEASDRETLDAAVDQAVRHETQLKAQAQNAARAAREIETARQNLAALEEGYDGPTLDQAKSGLEEATDRQTAAAETVRRLEAELSSAKMRLESCRSDTAAATRAKAAAEQNAALVKNTQLLIKAQEQIVGVPEEDLDAATGAVVMARACQERGVMIREAIKTRERQQRHLDAAQKAATDAEQWRARAGSVFDVLASAVKLDGVTIESVDGDPRLVVRHPKRPNRKTLLTELSDGERTLWALTELRKLLVTDGGKVPLFPIPQRVYQDLPPSDQAEIAGYCEQHGIYAFAALVGEGPLRCERFHANGKAS